MGDNLIMKRMKYGLGILLATISMIVNVGGCALAEGDAQAYLRENKAKSAPILPQYAEAYAQNNDMIGWLTIEDTPIDYPVMYTPNEPSKYLYADFDGNEDKKGLPFIDENCTLNSDNILIHGHNMRDNSMFGTLPDYAKESYYKKHPTIRFDTLYEEGEYEIMFAFRDRVYYTHETCFKFYQFINAKDEADFDQAMASMREKALYDTGVEAHYGDKLLTLVTCAYHVENGRFVVVARKK